MRILRVIAGLAALLLLTPTQAAELPHDEIVKIAREAYIWGYPVVDNYSVLHSFALDKESPDYKAPPNTVAHVRSLAGPADRTIVAPNVDTLYSYAWLDLRAEPVVLSIPPFENNRYVSLQLIDAYTYILGYVTPRTSGNDGGNYLVAGPGWKGRVPPGIKAVFHSPTDLLLAHYRTQVMGGEDMVKVNALQDSFGVATLSAFLGEAAPAAAPVLTPIKPVDVRKDPTSMQFFRVLNWMMSYMPVLPEEQPLRTRLAQIGIGPGLPFDPDAETETAIRQGMADALAEMNARALTVRSSAELFGSREFLGQDYLIRAVAAMIGIYGNSAEEFLGVGYQTDSQGKPFDGRNRYTITFSPSSIPVVGAFWSITAYTKDRFLYPNPLNRYGIGSDVIPDLVKNTDGGFTIFVQHESPGPAKEANWLPVPDEPFVLTFRTYQPGEAIRDGSWRAPPVVKE